MPLRPAATLLPALFSFALLVPLATAEAADAPRPLKVYILAGQSNMEGQGRIAAEAKRNAGQGSLEYLAKNPPTAPKFAPLLGPDGKWAVRDDVWISYLDRHGPLTVGYGAREPMIGPELGFGWVVGDAASDPVLLIKCAWGGKSLAIDFRPPSAGKFPYQLSASQQQAIDADPAIVGKYYRETLSLVRAALANLDTRFPQLAGRKPQLVGFAWHQGWNDRINNDFNAEYEQNMVHFIRDMRRDLQAPNLPFVIAESGMSGIHEMHPRALSLMKAQAAVATHPEFRGNVAFVGTKTFWRDKAISPSDQGYHWNSNAETYYLIGEAMGAAMLGLAADRTP